MKKLNLLKLNSVLLAAVLVGCGRSETPLQGLKETKLLAQADSPHPAAVTFLDLPVPEKPAVNDAFLARGRAVYEQNCVACHGVKGDAQADASAFLLPKPRNFQSANYRLRSTATGRLPTDVDLFRSVSQGMAGTPMPPWKHLLSETDRWAVVEYIKTFSPRFQDPKEERGPVVQLGAPPSRTPAAIAEGQALYTKTGCVACHGETGQGDGSSALTLIDDANLRIKPRDFSRSAGFKSGYATKEIVRSILTGFNGTPMPGFDGTISKEDAWKLAYYVETFAKTSTIAVARVSQNFLERETLGEPDVRLKLRERAWKFDPPEIRVRQGQIVEITFEPTDNGLGVGHGFAISSYDEVAFINGAMVGAPKSVKFRADRAGKFTFYCPTQCSTDKLHPLMNGFLFVEPAPTQTAQSRSEETDSGSTGYQPEPSGNLPGETGAASRNHSGAEFIEARAAIPVGKLPTAAGKLPALPIFQTRSQLD